MLIGGMFKLNFKNNYKKVKFFLLKVRFVKKIYIKIIQILNKNLFMEVCIILVLI